MMEVKEAPSESDDKINWESEVPVLLESGTPRLPSLAFNALPVNLLHMMRDYLSEDEDKSAKCALLDVQPIALCLSQDVISELSSCWYMGFLPSECQWQKSTDVKVDKQFPINDHEGVLSFLNMRNPRYCRMTIDVLVVKLRMPTRVSPNALPYLRRTIEVLQNHLSSVKHLVFSITEGVSFYFDLKGATGATVGVDQVVNRQRVLSRAIDDLEACWKMRHMLTPHDLLDVYYKCDAQPASEKYLTKIVISLGHQPSQYLFKLVAPNMLSNKIMWIYHVNSIDGLCHPNHETVRQCHAVHLDMSTMKPSDIRQLVYELESACNHQSNPFIQRIVVTSNTCGRPIELHTPQRPLTNNPPFSALIELTLHGSNALHLTDLNNGYFQNLAHLTVVGGLISGHLDSGRVPNLRTLRIEPKSFEGHFEVEFRRLAHERVQSLICHGRPWQLVITRDGKGLSLASFDEPISNPQYEEKEDVPPHSLPLIKELLLMARFNESVGEWQSQLDGGFSPEADANDHSERILQWAPECVQKMTLFGGIFEIPWITLDKWIPGQMRILSSLECYGFSVVLDGAVLPCLKTLEIHNTPATLSNAFPQLESIVFVDAQLKSPWELDAPLLQSLSYRFFLNAPHLHVNLQLLPRLSFLCFASIRFIDGFMDDSFPNLLNIDGDVGLSQIQKVVFGKCMKMASYFDQCQVNLVSHLELAVDALNLPTCWYTADWRCETLVVNAYAMLPQGSQSSEPPDLVVLPQLLRVKKLTVTEENCCVLINTEFPELAECTVPSPELLGPELKCPALRCIRFTEKLSASEKKQALDRATYRVMGARPKLIYFDHDAEVSSMTWDSNPNEQEVLF